MLVKGGFCQHGEGIDDHREEIETLLAALAAMAPAILASVDRGIETVNAMSATLDAMNGGNHEPG